MMIIDYALFDIRIRGASQDHYSVDVHSDLGGDASGELVIPSANSRYQQLAERLQRLETSEDELVELGQILFQALFQGNIKEIYARAQGRLQDQQGQRLRFNIDPALVEIAALPWEFLYDPDQGPLALLDTPIVRYLSQQAPTPTLTTPLPLKVLITGAVTPPESDVERELREVRAALAELEQKGQVTIQVEEHLTQTILQRRLREGFQIWHFIGHGGTSRDGRSGTLLFEDGPGSSKGVSAAELNILLNRSGVRLIMLDSCTSAQIRLDAYRSIAPALIRAQVPAVIAMQMTVPEEATRAFASEFYRTLAEGLPIDACVTEGRKAVMNETGLRNPDWGIPVVYTRAPDGKLFVLPAPSSTSANATPASATPTPSSGVNVSIGSGNVLREASSINISNVGNIHTSDAAETSAFDDDLDERIQALEAQVVTYRRQISALELKKASLGMSADVSIILQLEDNERAQLAAMDQIIALRTDRVNSLRSMSGGAGSISLADAQQALQKDTIRRKTMELRVLERKAAEYPSRQTPYDREIAALRNEIAKEK